MTEPPSALARALRCLAAGDLPGEQLTADAFADLMQGRATPAQVAGLLIGLRVRGESADELTGAVRAMRDAMIRVPVAVDGVIDTCGTGGGGMTTFNVSTAAALVAAGAGAKVAKHGNRSHTSRCGSADVLEALGVPIELTGARAARLLEETGITFLYAPAFHPALKHAGPVRRELAVPTLFNIIGPLANPAAVQRQVVGVADRDRGPLLAETLRRLGTEHALVVHGHVGMDEISPAGETSVWEVRGGAVTVWNIDPVALGSAVGPDRLTELAGDDPKANALRLERLLTHPSSDAVGRAAVALNAGAALFVAGVAADYREGVQRAQAALDGGAGAEALRRLREAASTAA